MGTYVAERPISSNNGGSFYAVSFITHYVLHNIPFSRYGTENLRK